MNIHTCFFILRRFYGSHGAAAEAVGYKRARYNQFRFGVAPIPLRAANSIRAEAGRILKERPELSDALDALAGGTASVRCAE